MEYITKVSLSSSGRTNYLHYTAKQYDENSRVFICTVTDNTSLLTAGDTAKAVIYDKRQTIDVIDCSIDTLAQTITFTLSRNSLAKSGTIYIDISVFENNSMKLTCGSIIVDVVKSADVNISQNIDSGNSLYDKLREIDDKIDAINLDNIHSTVSVLNRQIDFAMKFITETATINTTDEYKLSSNKIAPSSPVNISVQGGAGNSTIVRTDGEDLVDILTGNIVDSTMATIRVTAQDVIAGIKATGSMGIAVKYYSYNCEDLLQMISNGGSAFTQTSYQQQLNATNLDITSSTYTVEGSE